MRFLPFVACLFLAAPVGAADLVRDERRLWSDGTPQEVWTYDGSILPENLLRKELFYEDGTKRSREEYEAGVQHGATKTWHSSGEKHIEETWVDGGRHGTVTHWPDPRDDDRRKKLRKPSLEATWENGKPHGTWREWEGWGENRWLKIEKGYAHGELDGAETVWAGKDRMQRKHAYKAGVLHGRQMAWEWDQMLYQFQFEDGLPHGPQRKYEGDEVELELFFDHGRLHGDMTWESWQDGNGAVWRHGIRSDRRHDDDGVLVRIDRWTYEPGEQVAKNSGLIQFHGEPVALDTLYFEGGRLVRTRIHQGRKTGYEWHPNGRLAAIGGQRSGRPTGLVLRFYDDGTLHRREEWPEGRKEGTWNIHDRRGRLVQVQTWDHYLTGQRVTVWRDDGTKQAEGDIQHAHGGEGGSKDGAWTYWRPDGTVLRTETYGPGPYSGNRPFIKELVEYDEEERPVLTGSEKEPVRIEYDPDEPDLVRRRLTLKPFDRSRHGLESWDPKTHTVVRRPVDEPAELPEGARQVEFLGGPALVVAAETFRSDGSRKHLHRWDRGGTRHGLQEGWYRDGSKKYVFEYRRGEFRQGQEWGRDGEPREPQPDRHIRD